MDVNCINIIVLAYLGDSVYELYVREKLIEKGYNKPDVIQKNAVNYVSAKSQSVFLDNMINNNILTEEEIDIVKRGRNYKRSAHPKNTDIITYKMSSGFEALIGYLYLTNKDRLHEILNFIGVK